VFMAATEQPLLSCGQMSAAGKLIMQFLDVVVSALAGLLGFVLPLYALGFGESLSMLLKNHDCSMVLYICVSFSFLSIPMKRSSSMPLGPDCSIPLLSIEGSQPERDLERGEGSQSPKSLEDEYEEDWTMERTVSSSATFAFGSPEVSRIKRHVAKPLTPHLVNRSLRLHQFDLAADEAATVVDDVDGSVQQRCEHKEQVHHFLVSSLDPLRAVITSNVVIFFAASMLSTFYAMYLLHTSPQMSDHRHSVRFLSH